MPITTILSNLRTKLHQQLRSLRDSSKLKQQLFQLQKEAHESLMILNDLGSRNYLILNDLVVFYKTVSPWCDRSAELYELERKLTLIDSGQHTKAREALVALATQEERNEVNRTSFGQEPSMYTIYLGGACKVGFYSYVFPMRKVIYWELKEIYWSDYLSKQRRKLNSIGQLLPLQRPIQELEYVDKIVILGWEHLHDGLERWESLLQDLINS
jgi:hypothetical protein